MLLGRRSDCAKLDRLLSDARAGRSGSLVVRGEAGVGKTALLRFVIDSAADLRVARALGVESEMELPGVVLKTRLDLDDAASIRAAVTDAVERLGALDVLVANAARWPIDARGPLSESDPDVWARALRANLEGTAQRCARRCPI